MLSSVETPRGQPVGRGAHGAEPGGFEEAFLAKSIIPSLGVLICQGVLNNSIDTSRLGEGAEEESAARGAPSLGTPPRPHHGDGHNLLLIPPRLLWRGDAPRPRGSRVGSVSREGIFLPHVLLPAQQPRPRGSQWPGGPAH